MFGAIYVGLSGLTSYSKGLQQVSNNVSNLNSLGFKAGTVTFNDLVSERGTGGMTHSEEGTNSGGGVGIGETRRDFRQGDLRQTERDLDLAVDGSGFLVLLKGDEILYSRTGSFEVNREGFIVLAGTEYRLATLGEDGRAVSLSIDLSRTNAPVATTRIKFADNLSSTATEAYKINDVKVYDATGGEHLWKVEFAKDTAGEPGDWKVTVTDDKAVTIGTQIVKFRQGLIDASTRELVFAQAASGLSVTFDFSQNVTNFSSGEVSTLRTASVDGHKTGTITTVQVNADGKLEIAYSNEQKEQLGSVAIADFRDPQALEQRSGGLLIEARDAGRTLRGSGEIGLGRVLSRRLEASNVDLAQQFGDLILIQRGFQASSQIISVSNDMIQQLFGIRGQG